MATRARVFGYHRVTDSPNPALADWAVSPAQLDQQMAYLAGEGYEAVICSELLRRFDTRVPMERVVAITFDDSYSDTVTTAAPILARYGFVATIFAVPGHLGGFAEWDARYGGAMAPIATAEDLRAVMATGWEIGHHTITHAALTRLSDSEIRHEVFDGADMLSAAIGAPVPTFAHPFSMQNAHVRALMAAEAPFTGIFAAGRPIASADRDRTAIERVFPLGGHTLDDFESLLTTGVDLSGE